MGFLKFLGKFFGSFLIVLALTIIFTGIMVQYSVENLNVISQSAQENFPKILQENKGLLLSSIEQEGKINKAMMKSSCVQSPDALPKDFCNRLNSMTEDEALKEFTDIMVLKFQDEYKTELGEGFEQEIESQLKEILLLKYLKYVIPLGILVLLLGYLVILLAEKFDWLKTLSYLCWKTGVISGLVAVTNFLMKNVTKENVENLLKNLPVMQGEGGGILAVKLLSAAFTDWIKVISAKMFYTSLIITILSFLVVIILFVLKRKIGKEKPKEKIEEKTKEIIKEKKIPKVKKKGKVLFKKKK